ncbi:MAG: tetratricopeptide repeat protein [Deltaproteobacteria bacterium]|nr:MAG: tetratricopeptide repeat protein [Deltaproteobacteria bacterium]
MSIQRYFEVFNLDSSASLSELKKAYRDLVHLWHPDCYPDSTPEVRLRAEEKLKEINLAYAELQSYLLSEERKDLHRWAKEKSPSAVRERDIVEADIDEEFDGLGFNRKLSVWSILFLVVWLLVITYSLIINNRIHKYTSAIDERGVQEFAEQELEPSGEEAGRTNGTIRTSAKNRQLIHIPKAAITMVEPATKSSEKEQFTRTAAITDNVFAEVPTAPPDSSDVSVEALQSQAATLFDTDPQTAQALLHKAVELRPDHAKTYFYLGKLYTQLENYAHAIACYRKAADLDPRSADTLFNLGFAYAKAKDYSAAEDSIGKVIDLSPPYLDEVYFNLAMVQRIQGKQTESIRNLEKALEVNPENPRARKYLLRFKNKLRVKQYQP